ncbi:MAG TPA: GTPase [Candidatus Nanoarchaeia archaeon]|nr:GTPase [Candidatus Nanoarchaeia archaeon]
MPSFWEHVNKVLREADIIIEVLDARMIEETRNKEVEDKIKRFGKQILYVITKSDLISQEKAEQAKKALAPSVFISAKLRWGTTILKKKILELSKGQPVVVGVLGYPNVGKSSLINALGGKHKARTSSESGYTKGVQNIRINSKILLLDTPGVFPNKEKDVAKHGKIGAVDYSKIKDPEVAALTIISEELELIRDFYQVFGDEPEEILEQIAFKLNKLIKKGRPDLEVTARLVLKDWQTGKINSRNL